MGFSATAVCATNDASAGPRAELETVVRKLEFGYCNYSWQL